MLTMGNYHRTPTGCQVMPTGPRRCRAETCEDCDTLNKFLASENEKTWWFRASATRRQHIVDVLPFDPDVFALSKSVPKPVPTASEHKPIHAALVVEKMGGEFTKDLDDRRQKEKNLYEILRPLGGNS